MGYELNLAQTQKLILTPELRQAITVLQLSSLELAGYIEQQLQENPLLELYDDDGEKNLELLDKNIKDEAGDNREYDLDWELYFQDSSDLGLNYRERKREQPEYNPEYNYENFISRSLTLAEHVLSQLHLIPCTNRERLIAEYLIGNIDQNGYLQVSLGEVADRLKVGQIEAARALLLIQGFDPLGVGARNLQECLMIQYSALGIENGVVKDLIENYLELLARGNIARIAHELGATLQEVQAAADILKTLDPKPGRNFSDPGNNRYITPDIIVEKVEGEYIILINDTIAPKITINSTYRSVLAGEKNCDPQTRRFVEGKLNAAVWLIRSIEQRRLTLYKVANCLAEMQRGFLDHGIKYLKPLSLKNVAERVGLHESTISRATANKYIQTPQGVFEMKQFFCTGLPGVAGSAVSSSCIKEMLQEIIAAEDCRVPLNDQKLSNLLEQKGIKISRRTVAKYRSELNIPAVGRRIRY